MSRRYQYPLILVLTVFSMSSWGQDLYSDYGPSSRTNIFFDDFVDNRNNWEYEVESGKAEITGTGQLKISSKGNSSSIATRWSYDYDLDQNRDFEIEVNYKLVPSDDYKSFENSIYWAYEDPARRYLKFGYSEIGSFTVFEQVSKLGEEDEFLYKHPWASEESILKEDYNRLTIRKAGFSYYFFINGTLVHSMPFERFSGNMLGISAAKYRSVLVEYFRVSYLNKSLTADTQTPVVDYSSQKRLALIIGNSDYQSGGSLRNPVNDARSIEQSLKSLGFTVMKYENSSQTAMKRAIDEFGRRLTEFDVGLFYFAGHGLQVKGNNYLVPTDAILAHENDVEYDCVRADRVLAKMESANSKTNIVILDACRNNPFERSWNRSGQGNGLAFMNAPAGSLVAYATAPGSTAADGTGSNGLYTAALLEHIGTPNLTIEEVFKRVRTTVSQQSSGGQIPWESTSLTGNFVFRR